MSPDSFYKSPFLEFSKQESRDFWSSLPSGATIEDVLARMVEQSNKTLPAGTVYFACINPEVARAAGWPNGQQITSHGVTVVYDDSIQASDGHSEIVLRYDNTARMATR